MFPSINEEMGNSEIHQGRWLVKIIMVLSIITGGSSRMTSVVLLLLFNIKCSHKKVLTTLKLCSEIAKIILFRANLSPVKTASFDEIFQNSSPVLGFADKNLGVNFQVIFAI